MGIPERELKDSLWRHGWLVIILENPGKGVESLFTHSILLTSARIPERELKVREKLASLGLFNRENPGKGVERGKGHGEGDRRPRIPERELKDNQGPPLLPRRPDGIPERELKDSKGYCSCPGCHEPNPGKGVESQLAEEVVEKRS